MIELRVLTIVIFFLCGVSLQAQNFEITGTLKDKTTKKSLEAATVYLETIKDSTLVTYTITNQNGNFTLEGRSQIKDLRVNISFLGYENYTKKVDVSKENIALGDIEIAPSANTLDEVVVKSRAPITVKKDTLEFNVSSFKTKKDANIEDLLKELPGVDVNDAGEITVNGKPVNKILVNGKPFFGDDPTIATRNLTKEIVEKIQVTDTKTEDEAFTGEDGDQESKTINLTISEDKNKGVFGRVAAGGGTDSRFEYAGIVNAFDNDRRVSVLGGGNNINASGFSFGEITKMFGSVQSATFGDNGFTINGRSFGGGQGVVNSRNAGANYTDVYSKQVNASVDYFYSGANSFDETSISRENILPDSRFFSNSTSRSDSNADNHSVNGAINIKIDSTLLLNIRPSFEFADNTSRYRESEASTDDENNLINQSRANNFTEQTGRNFTNNISISKKWGDRGAYIKARFQNQINSQENEDFVVSNTEIFGDVPETINRNQFTDGETRLDGFNLNLTHRIPLISKKLFLDLSVDHRNDIRNTQQSTFDFDETTQDFSLFNDVLSSDFESINKRTTPGIGLNYTEEKYSVTFNSGYVFRTLENEDRLRPELNIKQRFEALEFNTYFRYRFSPKMSLYGSLSKSNRPPEVTQLNPFVDVSDPLNIRAGNPDLSPSNVYRFYAGFNNYDYQKGGGYYLNFNGNITNDAVISRTTVDDNLVRTSTYENVDGNYNINGWAGYNKKIKLDSLRTLSYNISLNARLNRNINFNNDVQYASRTSSISPNIGLNFNWKQLFELRPNYSISLSRTIFGIDLFEDQNFVSHTAGLDTALFIPNNVEWRNDFNYNFNPNIESNFQRSSWFWNTTLAYTFAKDKFTATAKVYDVLNQNTNARRTANANFIQDVQSTVLEQYVILGLSWKFNTLGKKGETDNDPFYF